MLGLQIRTNQTIGMASLYTRLKVEGKSVWVDLHLMVNIEKWNKVKDNERKISNYLSTIGHLEKIYEIEVGINDLRKHYRFTRDTLKTLIDTVTQSKVRERLVKDVELKKTVEERRDKDAKRFVAEYVDGIIKGEVLNNKGKRYSKNSINSWKQFRRLFLDCYKHDTFTWDELDQRLIHKFLNYLDTQGYMGETKSRHIGVYGTIISVSELRGLHNNGKVSKWLKMPTLNEDERRKQIYLTKEELKALYDMPLSGTEERVRDLFLIGCYTSLRFSDYSRIEEGCIGHTKHGTKVIRLKQQKTNGTVVIPIINDELEALLKKHNYRVPTISEQKLNVHIKEICRRLAKSVPTFDVLERTLLSKTERELEQGKKVDFKHDEHGEAVKHRWEMVCSHMARRTAITNMYLSRQFTTQQIMSVSGHRTESSLKRYLKLSPDEFADEVAKSASDGLF